MSGVYQHRRRQLAALVFALLSLGVIAIFVPAAHSQAAQSGAPVARPLGTIQSISGNMITLMSDAGPLFSVTVEDSTKLLRIEPGAKDLKNAMPLQMQDLQVGDRILVLGKIGPDGHSVDATSIVAMKKADVESKQRREQTEWERNGTGGLVKSVDPAAGTITISVTNLAGTKPITIHVTKDTVLRRYAPDSVKFDDAKRSTIEQINPGDQLRARGVKTADGTELTAEEIVSGSFRNISGVVSSVDVAANTITVGDLTSKKPVVVKITAESQVRKLAPQVAQLMAIRMKGGAASGAAENARPEGNGQGGSPERPGGFQGRGAARGGDIQQILSRMPPVTITDFQKGDAVMLVSTAGAAGGSVTAITLVGGVEPILQASPDNQMILPPWTLDAPSGDAAAQ